MQNHLESAGRGNGGGSFSAMLSSASDPCFGGPEHHHDFTTLNGSAGDFGHLLSTTQSHHHQAHHGHNNSHHQSPPETNNNNPVTSNNNNSGGTGNGNPKPKKVPPPNGKKTKGRVKIKMEFIDNKLRRYTTFSKRKTGIMKKAYELSTLTGTQVMLLVASETGHVYTFATRKLQPMITSEAGKALIQTCLNSPDPPNSGSDTQRMSATGYEETELTYAADPNGSEHGDTKDEESETGSSDGDEPKDVPSLLPPNFAALLAQASAAGFTGTKGGLTIGLVPSAPAEAAGSAHRSSSTSTTTATHHHSHGPSQSSSSAAASSSSSPSKSIRIKREHAK